jgi:hypothetical protein
MLFDYGDISYPYSTREAADDQLYAMFWIWTPLTNAFTQPIKALSVPRRVSSFAPFTGVQRPHLHGWEALEVEAR